MTEPLFDRRLRALRRDRAARQGPALFLHQRAFDDCLDRLGDIQRRFTSALLIGAPDPQWRWQLERLAPRVTILDPGPQFAAAAGGLAGDEDLGAFPDGSFDLCLAVGTLDTVSNLPAALSAIRRALRPDSLLIGALAGGDTLPHMRAAMRAADRVSGVAAPHVHPRIEAAALAALLDRAGFAMPVVDVDRVHVAYPDFDRLVADLRAMAATNILVSRARLPLSRAARDSARSEFARLGDGQVTRELFEILHFAAWSPGAVRG